MGWSSYKAYIVGGTDGSNRFNDTDEYSPDSWISRTGLPSPGRSSFPGSSILNKGYVYGGYNGTSVVADTDEYSFDTWVSKTDIPSPARSWSAASTINERGYIYCGTTGSLLKDTDEYDPDTWTNKTDCVNPARRGLAASTVDGKGYVFGGWDADATPLLQDTDEYDPDNWTSKTDMPTLRRRLCASTISNKGYVYGGDSNGPVLKTTEEYDPDSWLSKSDMPSPARSNITADTINSKGYVFAGHDNTSNLRDTDEYDPDTWASKTDMPSPARRTPASFSLGSCWVSPNTNHVYFDDPYVFNSSGEVVEIYDFSTDSDCAIAYILYDSGINCTTKIGESNLLLATTNSGIKSFNTTNVSGTTDSPVDLSSYLSGYKSYPEITNNYVNYLHASEDYLCVTTISGVDHFNLGNSDSYDKSSTTVSGAIKCHQTESGEFYYVFTDKVNAIYTYQCDWSDSGVSYTYDTTGSGILPAFAQINDFYVVERNPNLLFFATTSGVVMVEEKRGNEDNARYKRYLVEE